MTSSAETSHIEDYRFCGKCGIKKDVSEFPIGNRSKRPIATCMECNKNRLNEAAKAKRIINLQGIDLSGVQECLACNIILPRTEFYRKGQVKSGMNRICLTCMRQKGKERYQRDKEKRLEQAKWGFIKRKFGITKEKFLQMLDDQKNSCAICTTAFTESRNTCVDHDHLTDKVRGILCRKCNLAIGLLGDSPVVIQRAANYLVNHSDIK